MGQSNSSNVFNSQIESKVKNVYGPLAFGSIANTLLNNFEKVTFLAYMQGMTPENFTTMNWTNYLATKKSLSGGTHDDDDDDDESHGTKRKASDISDVALQESISKHRHTILSQL